MIVLDSMLLVVSGDSLNLLILEPCERICLSFCFTSSKSTVSALLIVLRLSNMLFFAPFTIGI